MRESTWWNQANGSTLTSSHHATKLRKIAAVRPPRSLPKKVQLLRPTAHPRREHSYGCYVCLEKVCGSPRWKSGPA